MGLLKLRSLLRDIKDAGEVANLFAAIARHERWQLRVLPLLGELRARTGSGAVVREIDALIAEVGSDPL